MNNPFAPGRNHLFHIVNNSVWPLFSSLSAFFLLLSFTFYMHSINYAGFFLIFSFILVALCMFFWFSDIVTEATNVGYHTLCVRSGITMGFLLFIVSELMLFFGFFWAFFHSSLCPSFVLGGQWPPVGITVIPIMDYPLFNTFLLLVSGLSITWAHSAVSLGSVVESTNSFIITIALGFLFVVLQISEYIECSFNISDSVYASSFFMLTGLHGLHVIVGASFILICFISLMLNHYTVSHYLGFVFAIWYWHFVDVVWVVLFFSVYAWGNW